MEEKVDGHWKKYKKMEENKKKMAKKEKDLLFENESKVNNEEIALDEEVESKPTKKNKELTINFTINPHNVMKWGGIVLLAVLIFFMGTLVGTCDTCEIAAEDSTSDDASFVSSVSGFFTGMFSGDGDSATGAATVESESEEEVEETAEEELEEEEPAAETEESEEEVEETAEEEIVEEETIITTYNSVALAISDVDFDWKGTWGKVTKLHYTIKNNEAGTIEPGYIMIQVEGYPDEGSMKKALLAPSSKTIKSGTKVSSVATVEGGFSYSELSTGDLSDVTITATLYDDGGKEIATYTKGFNLQG